LRDFILPNFPIDGNDLKNLGLKGVNIGKALTIAKKYWVKNNFLEDKRFLLKYVKSIVVD
jgi:hypothetical protein